MSLKDLVVNVWNWLCDVFPILALIVSILAIFGGIVLWTIHDDVSYRDDCHAHGGHIIAVRGGDVCVDPGNRVIYVDAPTR